MSTTNPNASVTPAAANTAPVPPGSTVWKVTQSYTPPGNPLTGQVISKAAVMTVTLFSEDVTPKVGNFYALAASAADAQTAVNNFLAASGSTPNGAASAILNTGVVPS